MLLEGKYWESLGSVIGVWSWDHAPYSDTGMFGGLVTW